MNRLPAQSLASKTNPYPWYSPRFWHGKRFRDWFDLLRVNRFSIHPARWPLASIVSFCSLCNSSLAWLHDRKYGKQIEATPIAQPPVFIIGHWRSGTTLLHELMVHDPRYCFPSTYQCFMPHHFRMSEWLMTNYFRFLLPKKRPMDNMEAGWEHPQEDEFALENLGVPTVYSRMAFPNHPTRNMESLDMQLSQPDLQRWQAAMLYFAKSLTLEYHKPILFKSPPHTGRLQVLSQLFPGAKFIHMARDPYSLFPSTVRLWNSLDEVQALQRPKGERTEEFVFDAFSRMYASYEVQRADLPPSQLAEVKYEQLVKQPAAELQRVYEQLGLGDFESIRPAIEKHMESQKAYQPNTHQMEPRLVAQINDRWSRYFELFSYPKR